MRSLLAVVLLAGGFVASAIADTDVASAIAAGDLAWAHRAETLDERLATPSRIDESMRHYRLAHERDPASFEAAWKLLRALHYAIDFTTLEADAKDECVREAVELARASIPRLESDAGSSSDRARLLFWSAIAWGTRAQRVGLLTVVREGVATRMHDYAARSLALDPGVDRGGALRLLSRLHATLPRVPFVSGWVDRDEALPLAERGHALDPEHPGNRLILALVLEERFPERLGEARRLLESVADSTPRPDYVAEDLAIREQARERLAALAKASG